jgi:hypothetical protein
VNPTPSPTPIEVLIRSGPAEWWQVLAALGPLAILIGAVLAAVISWWTLRQRTAADALALAQRREADTGSLKQKTEADSRAEWWRRTQWAIDSALSIDPDRAKVGLGLMEVLAETAPGAEELRIISVAWEDPLDVAVRQLAQEGIASAEPVWSQRPGTASGGEPAEATGRKTVHRPASYDRGVQAAAAKLRLATDRRLGHATPEWIRTLAAEA